MNAKMSTFGWGAVAVRGFIPPWAFMEFQSLGILPIACDMRSSEHLTYTPAPDIVHESSGHSPIIVNQEYAHYLKEYGRIASNAIFSKEDEKIYYAIRKLSDIKEDRSATIQDIKEAEKELKDAKENQINPSEATLLSRLHWWTVEYGLIGPLKTPKIYGAGLLSSVGESQNCLTNSVKKIPFSIDCINYNYDITEQQPQLFVTESFSKLTNVLYEFEKTMNYYNNKSKTNNNNIEEDQISKLNQNKVFNSEDEKLVNLYKSFNDNSINLKEINNILDISYKEEWLLRFNIYQKVHHLTENWIYDLKYFLINFKKGSDLNNAIQRGLELIK
jgi:phenylalanine-4-hydroxylase